MWHIGAKDEPGATLIVERKRLQHSMFFDEKHSNCFCSYCGLLLDENIWRVVEKYYIENFFILNSDFVKRVHVSNISDFD